MDHPPHAIWAKHLIKAAIEFFNERSVKACLLVDNAILNDSVLSALCKEDTDDFIICVSPGFTTQLDFGVHGLSITVRLDNFDHALTIPYPAIRAVLAGGCHGTLTDHGELNVITIPPVVYPPGSPYRDLTLPRTSAPAASERPHTQPAQAELQLVARRS